MDWLALIESTKAAVEEAGYRPPHHLVSPTGTRCVECGVTLTAAELGREPVPGLDADRSERICRMGLFLDEHRLDPDTREWMHPEDGR